MHCTKCGSNCDGSDKFCSKCGSEIKLDLPENNLIIDIHPSPIRKVKKSSQLIFFFILVIIASIFFVLPPDNHVVKFNSLTLTYTSTISKNEAKLIAKDCYIEKWLQDNKSIQLKLDKQNDIYTLYVNQDFLSGSEEDQLLNLMYMAGWFSEDVNNKEFLIDICNQDWSSLYIFSSKDMKTIDVFNGTNNTVSQLLKLKNKQLPNSTNSDTSNVNLDQSTSNTIGDYITYKNDTYNFTLNIPKNWDGKYKVSETSGESDSERTVHFDLFLNGENYGNIFSIIVLKPQYDENYIKGSLLTYIDKRNGHVFAYSTGEIGQYLENNKEVYKVYCELLNDDDAIQKIANTINFK